jgi:hypothetical protein
MDILQVWNLQSWDHSKPPVLSMSLINYNYLSIYLNFYTSALSYDIQYYNQIQSYHFIKHILEDTDILDQHHVVKLSEIPHHIKIYTDEKELTHASTKIWKYYTTTNGSLICEYKQKPSVVVEII